MTPGERRLRALAGSLRERAARIGLPFAPSPLELAVGLPPPWSEARLFVKRDELLGPGGTKIRKLAWALDRAKEGRAQAVLTFGMPDSNHALATAGAARRAGLETELWIEARGPEARPERASAFAQAAERVSYRERGPSLALGALGRLLRARLSGRAVALLPPGGTTTATTAAVAPLVLEVVEQLAALGEPVPERWAVAVGSGGTLAGVWAGVKALGLRCRPVGFCASDPLVRPWFVAALANAALDRLGAPGHVSADEVEISLSELGRGHGLPTHGSRAAAAEWAAAGLPLDPVFTAKVAAGVRARLERGPSGQRWLFLHTGTQVGP
ncbi:MAG: pyridoxal-phosphate dependent enzyme [Deltaproteobacteria bacterium]